MTNREYWLVWSSAAEAFISKGSGVPGDFAKQLFDDDQIGVLVEPDTWAKNGGWTAEEFRDGLAARLSARFAIELASGCASPKGRIQCDDQAQARIEFVISIAEKAIARDIPIPAGVNWTMQDRSQEPHSLEELTLAMIAMGFGFQAKMTVRQSKEAAIRNPTATVADLMAIDIDAGWPE